MADASIEKITLALENLAMAVNRAVENMNRVESKRETSISSERASEKATQSKEIGGKSDSTIHKSKGLVSPSHLALGVAGATVGAATYAAHKSGIGAVLESKVDNFFGGSVREGMLQDTEEMVKAGVQVKDEDLENLRRIHQLHKDRKDKMLERVTNMTQPKILQPYMETFNRAAGLGKAWEEEEGFRNQVTNNFGAVASDTASRIWDLAAGKLSFSDYIRGF